MQHTQPLVRDLVLLGGGHSHVIVIRQWAMNPIPGVRVTLISPDSLTPYSGMLPGLVAGHYSLQETHIDLTRLCRWAGVRFVQAAASGVDADTRRVLFEHRPGIEYDLLSVDTGGAPRLDNVRGAAEFAIPVKPVSSFHARWRELEARAGKEGGSLDIGVVGAGAGGFEILLAVNHRLNSVDNRPVVPGGNPRHRLHWLIRGNALGDYPARLRAMGLEACRQRGVILHHDFDVVEVRADGVVASSGESVALDATLWCTEAMAADWPADSGLDCDPRGFIRIADTLQSLSHPDVFAAGDVAVQVNHPRPRAGVFAVRQGPVLVKNLRRALLDAPLTEHRPQEKFLTLLSMGDRCAIGSKGPMVVSGRWVWQWKHWIDTRFMHRFNRLPAMPQVESDALPAILAAELSSPFDADDLRCGGCGAKVPEDVLEGVMAELPIVPRDDLPLGLERGGDVAVIDCGAKLLAQSVDQLRSFVGDPWLFGRIATLHALSDLYAALCTPQSAMVMVTLPWGTEAMVRRELNQLMLGVARELAQAGCALSGGHTAEGAEPALGLVVNGYPAAGGVPSWAGARPDDLLILTKPIGTGVILAADMRALATGPVVDAAIRNMLISNAAASAVLAGHGAHAVTDVTGFGLLGHLLKQLRQGGLSCRLDSSAVPVLPGAAALSSAGIRSSLYPANARQGRYTDAGADLASLVNGELLADPQTSGGLLAAVAPDTAAACLGSLREAGAEHAAIIGKVTERRADEPIVLFRSLATDTAENL